MLLQCVFYKTEISCFYCLFSPMTWGPFIILDLNVIVFITKKKCSLIPCRWLEVGLHATAFYSENPPQSLEMEIAPLLFSSSSASRLRTYVTGVIPLVVRGAVWRVVQEIVALVVVTVPEVSYSAIFWVCLAVIVRLFESVRFLLAALGAFLLLGLLGGLLFGLLTPLPLHSSVLEPDFDLE